MSSKITRTDLLIIGVTGKSGSGFDTDVVQILKDHNFSTIHSDEVVDAVWEIPEVLIKVAEEFGRHEIFESSSDVDPLNWKRKRGVLGELVANDVQKQETLNSILRPYLFVYLYERIIKLKSQSINKIALISPRLARSYLFLFCDYISYIERTATNRRRELLELYESRNFSHEYIIAKVNRTMKMQRDVLSPSVFEYDCVVKHPEDFEKLKELVNEKLNQIFQTHNKVKSKQTKKRFLHAYWRRGQFTRNALSLSQLTSVPIFIDKIDRIDPKEKGIRSNLIACANACATLCDGKLEFNTAESYLEYIPGKRQISGQHHLKVPHNTSISPMVQTILTFSLLGQRRVEFVLTGCTELNYSAPVNYFYYVFFPLIRKFGCKISLNVDSRGFLNGPIGRIRIIIEQVNCFNRLNFTKKGAPKRMIFSRNSIGAKSDLDHEFAEEIRSFARSKGFSGEFVTVFDRDESYTLRASSMSVALETEYSFLGADFACDQICTDSDDREALEELKKRTNIILTTKAALDPWCADQILLYLAIAGGQITIPIGHNMKHIYTQINLINVFKEEMFQIERKDDILTITSTALGE